MVIVRHCPNCGNEIVDGDFCTECGYDLSNNNPRPETVSKDFLII